MKKSGSPKRVILAIDLRANEPKLTEKIWFALKPFLNNGETIIEPVTILNREEAAMGNYFKNRIGSIRTATESHLGEELAALGLNGLSAPKVLFSDGSSNQRAVMALLSHAKKTKCDLIAISSHARKGVQRFFLGSFAETLSLQSPIPILVVNPNQRVANEKIKTVLFPTDFTPKSKAGLDAVCSSFSRNKPKIVLFHSLLVQNYLFSAPSYFGAADFSQPDVMFAEEEKRVEKLGQDWSKELQQRGFTCKVIIDKKASSVAQGILSVARRQKVGLIAIVSTTGKWEARLLGSSTRQVLRESPHPVWVVHPQRRAEARKLLSFNGKATRKADANNHRLAAG